MIRNAQIFLFVRVDFLECFLAGLALSGCTQGPRLSVAIVGRRDDTTATQVLILSMETREVIESADMHCHTHHLDSIPISQLPIWSSINAVNVKVANGKRNWEQETAEVHFMRVPTLLR